MKKYRIFLLGIFAVFLTTFTNDKPAYKLFTSEGEKTNYSEMIKRLSEADLVFFGELHNDPIAHWMQYEITSDIFSLKGQDLILAAEMFEADNQLLLDEYLNNLIAENRFEDQARLWNNYKTDYKPLVNFAREKSLKFIASNIPRRYASVVAKNGFEGLEELSDEAKEFIAPLPVKYDPEVECYKQMLNMGGMPGMKKPDENFPKAQAIKDATMAYFILKNWSAGKLLIHFNGSYHSDNYEGIVWYINQMNEGLNILTISTVVQDQLEELEEESIGCADFVLVVPTSMTKTY